MQDQRGIQRSIFGSEEDHGPDVESGIVSSKMIPRSLKKYL